MNNIEDGYQVETIVGFSEPQFVRINELDSHNLNIDTVNETVTIKTVSMGTAVYRQTLGTVFV